MRLNSDQALRLGRVLYYRFGCDWQAVYDACSEGPDGVLTVPSSALSPSDGLLESHARLARAEQNNTPLPLEDAVGGAG